MKPVILRDPVLLRKQVQHMTCEQFYEHYNYAQELIGRCIDELHWDGGFNADVLFRILKRCADEMGVSLTDEADFDFESFFENVWKCTEKGLS